MNASQNPGKTKQNGALWVGKMMVYLIFMSTIPATFLLSWTLLAAAHGLKWAAKGSVILSTFLNQQYRNMWAARESVRDWVGN